MLATMVLEAALGMLTGLGMLVALAATVWMSALAMLATMVLEAARGPFRRGQRCALTTDRPPSANALPTAPLHWGARPPEPPAAHPHGPPF